MTLSTDAENRSLLEDLASMGDEISTAVQSVIDGKGEVVRLLVTMLLAEGHVLMEDVPGVGKTTLAKALARSIACSVSRIQFTPDLLPGEITGISVYVQEMREFEFKPGPVFANIVLADEINRAPSKTQSALLECMEERQVTADGATYTLEPGTGLWPGYLSDIQRFRRSSRCWRHARRPRRSANSCRSSTPRESVH